MSTRQATVAAALLLLATLGGCAAEDPAIGAVFSAAAPPTVIAHRGFSARAPEHTLTAYDLAHEAGADYIEQDLQLTADGVLVVLHDATLDRTATGPADQCAGPVIEKTLEQIRDCDVGSWFQRRDPETSPGQFASERVPTLDEVFERFGDSARYYIETKNPDEAPGMEEELLRVLGEHGLLGTDDPLPRVYIQSFSPGSLQKIQGLAPDLPLVQLFVRLPSAQLVDSLDAVARYASGIGPHYSSVDSAVVRRAHELGLVIHPYTVNEIDEMRRLLELGTDGFFTDYPDVGLSLKQ